jgi:hypothetical protein
MVPYSYWLSGRDHQYAEAMMQFQHNFVKTVKDMRVTSKTIPHTIFDYPNFDDGEDAKVFHDDALLHHWREAAAACELYMLNSLFVVALSSYGIIIACSRLVKVEAKKVKNANNRKSSDFLKISIRLEKR